MNDKQLIERLNDLYAVERFSLANYLRYSNPWTNAETRPLRDAVQQIADEQSAYADQVGALIVERGGCSRFYRIRT